MFKTAPAAQSAPAYNGPTMCPKCSGKLLDISGKMVCEDCYHVVDLPAGARPAPQPMVQAPAMQSPPQPAARPAQAATAMPSACPKCNGKLVDIAGKPVCETCFHVVDGPGGTPAVPANAPARPAQAAAPQVGVPTPAMQPQQGQPQQVQPQQAQPQQMPQAPAQAQSPGAQNPALAHTPAPQPTLVPAAQPAAVPTNCPKCNGNLVNMAGAYVCESCYHTVDIPGATPPAPPSPTPSPLRPTAPSTPSNFAMPNPAPPPTLSRNSFKTPEEGEMSPQMIGGILLMVMLVLMIVFLAIKH
ncbi:MAG TPA: hypothetical protein V6C76_00360 [Drouetiella sp.]